MSLFPRKKCTFRDESRDEKNECWRRCFRNCTLYLSQGHYFCERLQKGIDGKKSEKVENRVKSKIDVTFQMEKVHFPPWDATVAVTVLRWESRRSSYTSAAIFKSCTFYQSEGHLFDNELKREKKVRNWKHQKRYQNAVNSRKGALGPGCSPKLYPTKHLARVRDGPLRGDLSLESKTDPKRRFWSSKNDEKARRILRIMLFSSSGFCDRLGQNNTFCRIICTSFWKKGRS